MNKNEVNTLRQTAHEIIISLMDAREIRALKLLEAHIIKAIEECKEMQE